MKGDQSTLQRLDSTSSSSLMKKLRHNKGMWFTLRPTHLAVASQIPSQQPEFGQSIAWPMWQESKAYWHPPGHACWTAFQHVADLAHRWEGKVLSWLQRMSNCPPLQQVSRTIFFPILQLGVIAIYSSTWQKYQDLPLMQITGSILF